MTIFWLKIFVLVFIAALAYYILILTQALIEATRAFSEQKKKEQGEEDSPSQIHVFFAPIILFLLVIWKYQYSLNVFIPIVAVFYWIMVIGLIIVLMIILIFFIKDIPKIKQML